MIGNAYTTSISAQAQTAAKTLIEIAAPSTGIVYIQRMQIGQRTFTSSEQLEAKVQRVTTTGTGTANTPAKNSSLSPAASSTVKTNMTAEPTYTSGTVQMNDAFSVLTGWLWTPGSDDELIIIPPSGLIGMMLNKAPSTSMDFNYKMNFVETG